MSRLTHSLLLSSIGMRMMMSDHFSIADRLSSATLALIAAINVALVALLLLTIATVSARSQDLPACSGINLLERLATDDPEAYAAILEEGRQVPFGDALLFRIEAQGVEPSWLFGTMHMTDPRVTELPDFAQDALEAAETVAIETTEILDPQQAQMALLSKPELTMFTDGTRISDFLTDGDRATLEAGLNDRGLRLALMDRMKPWLVAATIALPECEMARKTAGMPILDVALAQTAEADGKTLVGLETIVEQLEAMASLPMEFHVQGLVDTVAMGDGIDDAIETMIALYTEGQTGLVWPVLRTFTPSGDDGEGGYAAFEETMINARNRTMAERSIALIEEGGAFIAVGALHLPGEEGLARLFEQAGYTVTPVYK